MHFYTHTIARIGSKTDADRCSQLSHGWSVVLGWILTLRRCREGFTACRLRGEFIERQHAEAAVAGRHDPDM